MQSALGGARGAPPDCAAGLGSEHVVLPVQDPAGPGRGRAPRPSRPAAPRARGPRGQRQPHPAAVPRGHADRRLRRRLLLGRREGVLGGPGVWSTAAGYAGGYTPNPTYEEVCSARTGHTEVVLVVFDPTITSYEQLLKVFWEDHDPTQGMRQGNDIGTQYRSAIYYATPEQEAAARASRDQYQERLKAAGYGEITTEIAPLGEFFYAEDYHQQYLYKVPNGYCPMNSHRRLLPRRPAGRLKRTPQPATFVADRGSRRWRRCATRPTSASPPARTSRSRRATSTFDGEDGDALRVAVVDEGPADGEVVLLLHGEPSGRFLYRTMIPVLVAAGLRVVAPDLVGFGRSDKPADRGDYSYARHVEWMRQALFDAPRAPRRHAGRPGLGRADRAAAGRRAPRPLRPRRRRQHLPAHRRPAAGRGVPRAGSGSRRRARASTSAGSSTAAARPRSRPRSSPPTTRPSPTTPTRRARAQFPRAGADHARRPGGARPTGRRGRCSRAGTSPS